MSIDVQYEERTGYLLARASGVWTDTAAATALRDIATEARQRHIKRILLDIRELSDPPSGWASYLAGVAVAELFRGLKMAAVFRPERITGFAETVARNRGANAAVLPDMEEAIEWLLDNGSRSVSGS